MNLFNSLFSNQSPEINLMKALKEEDLQNALVLVPNVTNVNYSRRHEGLDGVSLLMLASGNGYLEVCKKLIEIGANVDLQDSEGTNALMAASQQGHTEVIKLLLDKGANVDLQTNEKECALMLVSGEGHVEVVKLLLDAGAKIDGQDNIGYTALIVASEEGHTEVVKLLLDAGANIDVQDEEGTTALYMASQEGHTEVVKLLLDKGANVDLQTNEGYTVLIVTSFEGHIDCVKLLLNAGAKIDGLADKGTTALFMASQEGHTEVVKLLLDKGANVNLGANGGESALIIASQNGHVEVVKLLLDAGANHRLRTHEDKTAYDYAEDSKIISLLTTYMKKEETLVEPFDKIKKEKSPIGIEFTQLIDSLVNEGYEIAFWDERRALLIDKSKNIRHVEIEKELFKDYFIRDESISYENLKKVVVVVLPASLASSYNEYSLGGIMMGGIAGLIIGSVIDELRGPKKEDVSVSFEFREKGGWTGGLIIWSAYYKPNVRMTEEGLKPVIKEVIPIIDKIKEMFPDKIKEI